MPSSSRLHLDLPEPSLSWHPFFELKAAAVKKWLDTLPKANLGETAKQLYAAVNTLNRVRCSPSAQLDALEALRPTVHFAMGGMQKHFLNKPIPLNAHATQVAKLCHTLNRQLALGYCMVAEGLAGQDQRESFTLATHRALAEFSGALLRHYQLYTDPDKTLWLFLHRLFGLALEGKANQQVIKDTVYGHCSVQQAYLRPMMLASANPHQLTQAQLLTVFNALPDWVKDIRLQANHLSQCLLVFKPNSDSPPIYRELRPTSPGDIGIDTRALCKTLTQTLKGLSNSGVPVEDKPGNLSSNLVKHLLGTWSQLSTRNAPRIERDDPLYVAIGLHAAHYFIADQTSFRDFTNDEEPLRFIGGNPFMGRARDVWSESSSKDTFSREDHDRSRESFSVEVIDFTSTSPSGTKKPVTNFELYETRMTNASTTGYCIHWPLKHTAKLKTGTIAAVHEADSQHWLLTAVRWIRQEDNWKSQVGLELLADAVEAYSAQVQQAGVPHGKPQRALLLAANDVTDTPLRVLLPRPGFRSGQNLALKQPDNKLELKLGEELECTDSFSLFAAHQLAGNDNKQDMEPSRATEEFDSLWKQL